MSFVVPHAWPIFERVHSSIVFGTVIDPGASAMPSLDKAIGMSGLNRVAAALAVDNIVLDGRVGCGGDVRRVLGAKELGVIQTG